jgi:glycosyltransferase involved in cell wall biosynthesis
MTSRGVLTTKAVALNKKISICVLSMGMPFEHGGAELRAFRHVQYLNTLGRFSARLIAWDREKKKLLPREYLPNVYPVRLHFGQVDGGTRFIQLVQTTFLVGEIVIRLGWLMYRLRNEIDIIHAISAFSLFNLIPLAIAKIIKKPAIIEMCNIGVDDPLTLNKRIMDPKKQIFPHRPLKYSLFLQADAFVSKCRPISEAYQKAGLQTSRLFEIASAVDTELFCPPDNLEEKLQLRKKLGLKDNEFLLLFVGRIVPHKGLHWLLPAFRQIIERHPLCRLLILGSFFQYFDSYAQSIQTQITAMDLSQKVQFVGRVENVHEYLKVVDLFVLPTSHEGFSGAILEAMSSGLPIITSDIPEIAFSQIQNGTEGFLVPVGDTDRLVQALETLIQDSELRARLGQAARQRILRDFTFEEIGKQYMSLYKKLWRRG